MKEANFQTLFRDWIKEYWKDSGSAGFELKICKGTSMPFDSVKPHQIQGLKEVKYGFLFHKISDAPIFGGMKSRFTKPKPFDCFVLSGQAYVCIMFYKPRQKKEFIMIEVTDYEMEMLSSTRKSLTEDRAKEIGTVIIL